MHFEPRCAETHNGSLAFGRVLYLQWSSDMLSIVLHCTMNQLSHSRSWCQGTNIHDILASFHYWNVPTTCQVIYVLHPSGSKEQMFRMQFYGFSIGFKALFMVFFELHEQKFVQTRYQFFRNTLEFAIGRRCGAFWSLGFSRLGIVCF